MERFLDRDFTGAEFRECLLDRSRFVGVVMRGAEIDGLLADLTVNGVDVIPYVEAELDRRHPVRVLIRSEEVADLREAWRQLRESWDVTIERLRRSPGIEHESVGGEWSAIDPKPLSGDPHYEVAPLLWNRWAELDGRVREGIRDRFFAVVDAAGLDEERARDWVVVRMLDLARQRLEDPPSRGRRTPTAELLTMCVTIAKAVQG